MTEHSLAAAEVAARECSRIHQLYRRAATDEDDALARVRVLAEGVRALTAALAAVRADLNTEVTRARDTGLTNAAIGQAAGLSDSYVSRVANREE